MAPAANRPSIAGRWRCRLEVVGLPSATETRDRTPSGRIRVLRELGSPAGADVAFCAALDSGGGKPRLAVVERVVRSRAISPHDVETWLAYARQLVPLEHPNVARIRDVL